MESAEIEQESGQNTGIEYRYGSMTEGKDTVDE